MNNNFGCVYNFPKLINQLHFVFRLILFAHNWSRPRRSPAHSKPLSSSVLQFWRQCTVKHHTDIINFTCMMCNFVRVLASLSALCTNFYQICHWHCISCKILPYFDVRTISVAEKLLKLSLYEPPNCFTVQCNVIDNSLASAFTLKNGSLLLLHLKLRRLSQKP